MPNEIPFTDDWSKENSGATQISSADAATPSVLAASSAAIQQQNDIVRQAAQALQQTPMYSRQSQPQPQMPQPSLRSRLFANASPHNLDNQQPVTRAGARNKAIGQIAGAAAGIVGKYMQKKEAEKTQLLAQDVHRTMELYQGLEEAQTVLKSDPNNAEAKAAVQKNTALLNSVLNGKNAKEIAKAFDITFGKESTGTSHDDKQASMHYQAAQMAMKQLQQDNAKKLQGGPPNMGQPAQPNVQQQDRATQFQEQMPQRLMVSPAYEQAYKRYQDAVKDAATAQRTITPIVTASINADSRETVARTNAQAAAAREAGREEAQLESTAMRARAEIEGRRLTAGATVEAARIRSATTAQAMKDAKTEIAKITMGTRMYQELGNQIKDANTQITKLQGDMDKAKHDKKQQDTISADIAEQRNAIVEYKRLQEQFALYAEDSPDAGAVTGLINDLDNQ